MSLSRDRYIRFENFLFDLEERTLCRNGEPTALTPKSLELLTVLVENRGRIVEKNELIERIWDDAFVEEGNLAYTVRLLRQALGDDADAPKFIQTVPRRGYKFIAEVEKDHSPTTGHGSVSGLIPEPQNELIGRTRELAEITSLLEGRGGRCLTLTGPGGIGKTRLAIEIGTQLSDSFTDGVFFISLESVTDPSLVPTVVAEALSINEASWNDSTEALLSFLCDKSALLILDNFEQIVAARTLIGNLIARNSALKILITSRELLGIGGETEYLVPPLTVPPTSEGAPQSAFALSRYEAIEFFIDRARNARSGFELSDPDLGALAEICRRLEGLPLALELAAARARILSPPEILEKLDYGLALLAGGAKDRPDRQRTMSSAIEWSYNLLSDLEKEIFTKLSIFEGGSTFEAIEQVLTNSGDTVGVDLLDGIMSLCEKNLLINEPQDGLPRFRMLVVVREFAAQLLNESLSRDLARTHAQYFADLAERVEPELQKAEVGNWVRWVELEHDNLRAALKWAISSEPDVSFRIAKAMKLFWMLRGYTREGQYWYREVLKIEDIPSGLRRTLLTGLANMTQFLNDHDGAKGLYEESLRESRQVGDPKGIAQDLRGLAGVAYMLRDWETAKSHTMDAIRISRDAGDDFGIAAGTARLGDIALAQGDGPEAKKFATEALEIFRRLDFIPGVASKLMNLGMASIACGEITGASKHLRESLSIATEIGDYITSRLALVGLSFVLFEEGAIREATRLSAAADRMGEKISHHLEPAESRLRDFYQAKMKDELGSAAFQDVYEVGLQMEYSEVLRLAKGEKPKRNIVEMQFRSNGQKGFR